MKSLQGIQTNICFLFYQGDETITPVGKCLAYPLLKRFLKFCLLSKQTRVFLIIRTNLMSSIDFLDHMQGNFSVVCKFPCALHCFRCHECVILKKTLIPFVQFCKGQDGSLQSLGKRNHWLETFASCFWTHGDMNIWIILTTISILNSRQEANYSRTWVFTTCKMCSVWLPYTCTCRVYLAV